MRWPRSCSRPISTRSKLWKIAASAYPNLFDGVKDHMKLGAWEVRDGKDLCR